MVDETGLVVSCVETDDAIPYDGPGVAPDVRVANTSDSSGLVVALLGRPCIEWTTLTFRKVDEGFDLAAALRCSDVPMSGGTFYLELRAPVDAATVNAHAIGDTSSSPEPTSPAPSPTLSPRLDAAAVDEFWTDFVFFGCPGMPPRTDAWKSVAQMTANVDLVILGTPYAVDTWWDGRYGASVSVVIVRVERVLKGQVRSRRGGDVEVATYAAANPDPQTVAGIEHVLFLKNLGDAARGEGAAVSDNYRYSYVMESPFENVYADLGGEVVVPDFDELEFMWEANWYPLPPKLHGTSFDTLVTQVVDASTSREQRVSAVAAYPYFAC